ncbi:uncharacterized protein STEHIDRAFT_112886 [Stereum hirsutum FP-91666 SS1]|uniref:uncharacterized protein n=1 Tax=Stereum hirsutum (strain FP-91666) TaxID=721885 RepID=UPI0004449505|nr:uncharacterized protein STEHIDRAFT_112886 [Stereum hirsutum FP-91666 SS1]EIM84534.1 hypothetical protein STEHIDRAFT_112886 [Stereum hirsutum FP-91666 SS1]
MEGGKTKGTAAAQENKGSGASKSSRLPDSNATTRPTSSASAPPRRSAPGKRTNTPAQKRTQLTFSLNRPTPISYNLASVERPDLEPPTEFKNNSARRGRPFAPISATEVDFAPTFPDANDNDPPITQRARKPSATTDGGQPDKDHTPSHAMGQAPSSSPSLAAAKPFTSSSAVFIRHPCPPSSSAGIFRRPHPPSSSAVLFRCRRSSPPRLRRPSQDDRRLVAIAYTDTNTLIRPFRSSSSLASLPQYALGRFARSSRPSIRARVVSQEDEGTEERAEGGAEEAEE